MANIFNYFFVNTASSLKISYNKSLPQNKDLSEIVKHATKIFESHSSIIAIKNDGNPNDQSAFNPLQSCVAFLYPLKTSENLRFSDVFREYRKVTPCCNGLNLSQRE